MCASLSHIAHHKMDMAYSVREYCDFCMHWKRLNPGEEDSENLEKILRDLKEDPREKEMHNPHLKNLEVK